MPRKILVGDDNLDFARKAFGMYFSGDEVLFAVTPEELVRLAEENPDADIFTDLNYTENGREGYMVLERLRGRKVYLWTGNEDDPVVQMKARELGAVGVIGKDRLGEFAGYGQEQAEAPASDRVLVVVSENENRTMVPSLRKSLLIYGGLVNVIPTGELRTVEGTYRDVVFVGQPGKEARGESLVAHEDKYRERGLGYERVTDIPSTEILLGVGKVLAARA